MWQALEHARMAAALASLGGRAAAAWHAEVERWRSRGDSYFQSWVGAAPVASDRNPADAVSEADCRSNKAFNNLWRVSLRSLLATFLAKAAVMTGVHNYMHRASRPIQ